MNNWMLGSFVLALSLVSPLSNAAIIDFDQTVTGADMAGMTVTANFTGGGSESLIWSVFSTASCSESDIACQEGNSGGVAGTDWSLSQQGYTLGDFDPTTGDIYGLWTFTNNTNGIDSIVIDASATNILFDSAFLSGADTNGSGQGRPFTPSASVATGTYSGLYVDELFSVLDVNLSDPTASFLFLADTDAVVPVPPTIFLFGAGLMGLVSFRSRSERGNRNG